MGMLMIRRPETGQAVFTGRHVDLAVFRAMPVFFSRTHCPHCHVMHEWFAKDAWVHNSEKVDAGRVREREVA